jgi:hypothetical protein
MPDAIDRWENEGGALQPPLPPPMPPDIHPYTTEPRTVSRAASDARFLTPGGDAQHGLVLFVVFIVAALASTAAVVVLALTDEWWVLGFAFAAHLMVTGIVALTIVHAMAGRDRAIAARGAAPARSVSRQGSPAESHPAPGLATTAPPAGSPAVVLEPRTRQIPAQDGGSRVARRHRADDRVLLR